MPIVFVSQPLGKVQQYAHLPIVKDSHHTTLHLGFRTGDRREAQGHSHCNGDRFRDPGNAGISDYESTRTRLVNVLGSRAQADVAYDKLMKEADTYGQSIDSVVDLFIALCTASDECNP